MVQMKMSPEEKAEAARNTMIQLLNEIKNGINQLNSKLDHVMPAIGKMQFSLESLERKSK